MALEFEPIPQEKDNITDEYVSSNDATDFESIDSNLNHMDNTTGLSEEEENDPNRIHVEINDEKTPLIVFFGPASCGKTMTLIRLARYLRTQGYRIAPVENFRPKRDKVYERMCGDFPKMINSSVAATGTGHINFLLAKVFDNKGNTICQLLEGPGELYFDPNKATQEFPTFVRKIFSNDKLRKVFVFFVESGNYEDYIRNNYSSTLAQIRRECQAMNTSIFLHNKIDLTDYVIRPGVINMAESSNAINSEFNGIFTPFVSQGLFLKYKEYLYVPFSTGSYVTDSKGEQQYTQGSDTYPKALWEAILKCVRK